MHEPVAPIACCPVLGIVELGRKGRSPIAQPLESVPSALAAVGMRASLGGAGGKPLHLLQLDTVPRRVADDRVEAALRADILPMAPDPRESHLPVQEALPVGDGSGFAPQLLERWPKGKFLNLVSVIDAVRTMRHQSVCPIFLQCEASD